MNPMVALATPKQMATVSGGLLFLARLLRGLTFCGCGPVGLTVCFFGDGLGLRIDFAAKCGLNRVGQVIGDLQTPSFKFFLAAG